MEAIFSFLTGTVLGSFFGLLLDRLPAGESIIRGRSHCGTCRRRLQVRDLIPILSQVLCWSRCRFCRAKFSWWYLMLEAASGLVFLSAWEGWLDFPQALALLMSLVLAAFDWQNHEFPLLVWLAFSGAIILGGSFQVWQLIFLLAACFKSRYMGAGDWLWLFSISWTLSLEQLLWVVQIASLSGILAYFLLKKKGELAFIPFLAGGYLVVLAISQIL